MFYIPVNLLTFDEFLLELYLKWHLQDFPLPYNGIVFAFLRTVNKPVSVDAECYFAIHTNKISPQS